MTTNAYFLGLDLGQAADYSALAVLERQGPPSPEAVYHCRHLQRWPLRTAYPAIVADTAGIVADERLQRAYRDLVSRERYGFLSELQAEERAAIPLLAVDATGVGAPVVDLFRREEMNAQLRPVQITGGDTVTGEGGFTRVPKRDLVSVAQVALQTGRLKIAASLPEAATLTRELLNFQVKINLDTAHDSYGAWREGAHDDLVLAICLALWWGVETRARQPPVESYSYVDLSWA